MIAWLEGTSRDVPSMGGKAANLARLGAAGFDVPDGFVVAPGVDLDGWTDTELAKAVARIGGFPVAVRSSARAEDLGDASFAGQYETVLDVEDPASLRSAVKQCRSSGERGRVWSYAERRGAALAHGDITVLVQRMIHPCFSGVAFSIHPMTGREDHALVECVRGLGDRLVSGEVTPSRLVIDLRSGAVVERELGGDGADLPGDLAATLATCLLGVQASFGTPQDVEWAVDDDGRLWLLQSRPVTRIAWRATDEDLTSADFRDGGISARVCTPLMYSLYEAAFGPTMQSYLESLGLLDPSDRPRWMAHVYGRAYWNASAVKRALARVPGFDERKFDEDLGIGKDYGADGPLVVPTDVRTLARALPVALALQRNYRAQLSTARGFVARFPDERRRWTDRARTLSATDDRTFDRDLVAVLGELHARTEQTYFTTIYNSSNAQSDFKNLVSRLDDAIGGRTSIVRLMGGLSDVHHMQQQRELMQLRMLAESSGVDTAAFRQRQDSFLERFGFHADAELDLTCPRWAEEPTRVLRHVENLVRSGAPCTDPAISVAAQRRAYEEERTTVLARIRSRWSWRLAWEVRFRHQLARARAYLSAREAMRECSTQTYAIVRAYVVEAGRRLEVRGVLSRAELVFMLSRDELIDLARGRISGLVLRESLAYRWRMYEGYRDLAAPTELGRSLRSPESSSTPESVMRGIGCSEGRKEGTARVLRSLDEVHELQQGDLDHSLHRSQLDARTRARGRGRDGGGGHALPRRRHQPRVRHSRRSERHGGNVRVALGRAREDRRRPRDGRAPMTPRPRRADQTAGACNREHRA